MVIPLSLVAFRVGKIAPQQEERLLSAFRRLANQEMSALEDVYDLCAKDIYGLALWSTGSPSDAADILQEVFLKLAKTRITLISVQKPRNYILQITQRLGIDFYRERKKRSREQPIHLQKMSFIDLQVDPQEHAQLHNAIAKLDRKHREILYLRFFAGLSFSQISEVTGLNLFTAAGRCRIAKQKLKSLLKKKK